MRFVSLHHHSTHSYMDGFGTAKQHVERAAELGMDAIALTEHGNVSSHVQLEKATDEIGIKPIYGCELYTAPEKTRQKWHMTALAMNEEGYRNLNRLVSRAWAEGFYQWPTVHGNMLLDHSNGLIITSGCSDSLLNCTLLGGKSNGPKRESASSDDLKNAENVIRKFQDIFGDRYYLEVQQFPDLQRTRTLNPILAELSQRTGAPLLATADVHYPHPDDNEMQKILHAAGRGTGSVAAAEAAWEYDIRLTHPMSDAAIGKALMQTGLTRKQAWEAILNTEEVAQRTNVRLPRNTPIKFPLPYGYNTPEDLVWQWLRDGWKYRWAENSRMRANKREYVERLNYEMEIIQPKEFTDYFLMLSDAVRFAKDAGIPVGPARGSAAASLVCYLLRITEVDPLMFPTMVFERFIDANREDLPDVDLDFADDRRDEVRQHLVRRYGADRVGNIGNFVRYRGKNAVNDVARVYQIPQYEAAKINDLIIERSGGDSRADESLEDTFDMFPVAKEVLDKHPEFKYAMNLEGNMRGMSVHAAGLVISNSPITDTCALYERNVGGEKRAVLAYDKKDAEYLGMLKADFLGLRTMGMISIAIDMIGMKLEDLYRIPLDDPKTLKAFYDNDVAGIFQFGERATRLVNKDVKPETFLELADINALSRPGPLFSGMTAAYCDVKHGRAEPKSLHPVVDKITSWTKGQIIYQEQVLQIVREYGDFPWTHAAAIRKIISQKKGEAAFHANWENFRDGAKRVHGADEELSRRIWQFMITSASYAFNVAHCISYSMLGFWQMYLKQHYPLEFYTAQLIKTGDDKKAAELKRPRLLRDARRHGVKIKAPDFATSGVTWTRDKKTHTVRAGFNQIHGIGDATAERIIETRADYERAGMPWKGWGDLINVRGIGPKTLANIRDWAEQDDPFNLDLAGRILTEYRRNIKKGEGDWAAVPLPTHDSETLPKNGTHDVVWIGIVREREYKDLIEDERARTGRDIEEIRAGLKDPHLLKSCTLHCYDDGEEDVYVRINRWRFPTFRTALEGLTMNRSIIVASGKKREGFGISIQLESLIVIDPD